MGDRIRLLGEVREVLVGDTPGTMLSAARERANVRFDGFEGEHHSGVTMPSNSRTPFYPRGTEIRNSRQISIVSLEELAAIASALGISELPPGWLGANLVLAGIPNLSLLPPMTRLFYASADSTAGAASEVSSAGGAVLLAQGENHPCDKAADMVAEQSGIPELAEMFVAAARHLRGIVAVVERPGEIRKDDRVVVDAPAQLPYPTVRG